MPRGGRRDGAGRKPKPEVPFVPKAKAESVLARLGQDYEGKKLPTEDQIWLGLIACGDLRLRFDVMKYLTDRRDGKPIQPIVGDEGRPPVTINISALPRTRERA
jgi:hypothetical protein